MTSAHKVLTNTPRFSDTLRRIFSYSIFAKVMKHYDGSTVVQVFRLFNMLTVASCSETRPFKHLTNDTFRNPSFKEYITDEMSVIFFFQIIPHLMQISDIDQKTGNIFFVSYIIAH